MTEDLRITMEVDKLKNMYTQKSESYNAIIYGGTGVGKTSLLRTCRLPLHLDSFDPGGSKVLNGEALINRVMYPDERARGNIVVDTRLEFEDPSNPVAAKLWDEAFHERLKMGYFDLIGTYAIDSTTTWAQCIMYDVLKKAGRAGGVPQQNDYLPQMTVLENAIRKFLALPCDCILIGHDDVAQDAASGQMFATLLITGKLKRRVPLMFDEVYAAVTKETSKGIEYQLVTQNTGLYQAKSRLANKGQLETYEVADIKAILKKTGFAYEDKPPLFEEGGE